MRTVVAAVCLLLLNTATSSAEVESIGTAESV